MGAKVFAPIYDMKHLKSAAALQPKQLLSIKSQTAGLRM